MTQTIRMPTGVYGKTGTVTAYPVGGGAGVNFGSFAADSNSCPGLYTVTNSSISSGNYELQLIATGQTNPFSIKYALMAASGTVTASDDPVLSAVISVTLSPSDITNIANGVVSQLGSATIVLISPLSSDGTLLELVTGDSYTAANGRSLTCNITNQSNLIGTVPHLRIDGMAIDLAIAPTITSGTQVIVFGDILAATTSGMSIGNFKYQIRFMASPDTATVIDGLATVKQGL